MDQILRTQQVVTRDYSRMEVRLTGVQLPYANPAATGRD